MNVIQEMKTRRNIIMKFENKDTFELHNAFGMGEPNTAYAKYFIGIAIIVYFIVSFVCKKTGFWDKLDYSITITIFISLIYSQFLWKYNPFEKTPKLF